MNFYQSFAFLRQSPGPLRKRPLSRKSGKKTPRVEALEDRYLLSGLEISGFVYHDANNNGLFDPGESPIANSKIELHDAANKLVATTITDGQGAYHFNTDQRIDTTPATKTVNATFPEKATDWTSTQTVSQFDPKLGTLTGVDILTTDTETSTIRIENLDSAPATIRATVNGTVTLSGAGLANLVSNFAIDQSFDAGPFDGTIDFGGTSGHTFPPQSKTHSQTKTLRDPGDLTKFIGTGTVSFTENTHASSSATGSANLVLSVNTTAAGEVTLVYHYIPANSLLAGDYIIVQPNVPTGYLPGLKTAGNIVPIPNSVYTNSIPVTLGTSSLTNNNFGELKPSSLSGFVYHDADNNGIKETNEQGIANSTIALTGIDDVGNPVNLTRTTGVDGWYYFANLRPGTYTIAEGQPAGWLDGKDTIGSQGGTAGNDRFSDIKLANGVDGINNNFGELKPGSLAGFVYLDNNNNGVRVPGERGIDGVLITLSGIDYLGIPVTMTQRTAADGSYKFDNIRPGTYTIAKTHPDGYIDGRNSIGTQGGRTGDNAFLDITLTSALNGTDNNFAELLPPSRVTPPPPPPPPIPPQIWGKQFFMGYRSSHFFSH